MATAKKTQLAVKARSTAAKAPVKKPAAPVAPAKSPSAKKARSSPGPAVQAPASPDKTAHKKPKLVRDSFTIPKAEYVVLDQLKQRGAQLARPVKKSELLRAGIKALAAMPDAALLDALGKVPAIKTGRPAN